MKPGDQCIEVAPQKDCVRRFLELTLSRRTHKTLTTPRLCFKHLISYQSITGKPMGLTGEDGFFKQLINPDVVCRLSR
jgi:hypothetical protein